MSFGEIAFKLHQREIERNALLAVMIAIVHFCKFMFLRTICFLPSFFINHFNFYICKADLVIPFHDHSY